MSLVAVAQLDNRLSRSHVSSTRGDSIRSPTGRSLAIKPSSHAEHILRARDGWRLNVLDLNPGRPRSVVIAGHAMMADRRTLWRPRAQCLGDVLMTAGHRVLLPELRGRGDSGPSPQDGGDWSYADIVADTERYIELAQELEPQLPVVILGHSLFGHSALAYLGMNPGAPVRAVVAVAVNIWARRWNQGTWRWLNKRWRIFVTDQLTRLFGYAPAARLGYGSADEAATYWRDLSGWVRSGLWGVDNGDRRIDYHANLTKISCPVLHVVSDGDAMFGHPGDALRFSEPLPNREVLRVGPSSDHPELTTIAPDHMGLVIRRESMPVWHAITAWIDQVLADR